MGNVTGELTISIASFGGGGSHWLNANTLGEILLTSLLLAWIVAICFQEFNVNTIENTIVELTISIDCCPLLTPA